MRVYITPKDIELGRRGSPGYCPVARAVGRTRPGKKVRVGATMISEHTGGPRHILSRIPPRIRAWIEVFDRGGTVKPTSFTVAFGRLENAD